MGLSLRNTNRCQTDKAFQLKSYCCNHFTLFPEFISKCLFLPLFVSLLFSVNIKAQFDSLIFFKGGLFLDYNHRDVYALGDQNNDGYDDIMIYDCNREEALVFFGGRQMDTIPDIIIPINLAHSIASIDLNDDGKDDIVLAEKEDLALVIKMKIYWGGDQLDSIPDIIFSPPSNHGGRLLNINDFNGDGRDEFVLWDNFETSNEDLGGYYFYNTESEFDTIPHYLISGDSVNHVYLPPTLNFGDLNGDGKTDLTIYGRVGEQPPYSYFRNFYLGNSEWDLTEDQVFYQDEQTFDLDPMRIIKDINADGKDDILMTAYGGVYPFYWFNSILHGSFPVDTLQDVGLNTQNEALNKNTDARVGDVNGDGFNDLLIQTLAGYPDVKLWLGSSTMYEVPAKEWEGTSAGFGRVIAGVGDVNGDDVNDFAICEISFGTPTPNCNSGKVYIYMGDTSVVTAVEEEGSIIPEEFELFDPYPNPFNPATNIRFRIPEQSNIKIMVYDILGQQVTTLLDEEKSAGEYEIILNTDKLKLNSGTYIIVLNVLGTFLTRKVLLIK